MEFAFRPVLHRVFLAPLALALVLAIATPSAAQDVASLTGVVTDSSGAVVKDANVTLLDTLDRLRAKGNTLVVVEHDEDTIRRADHVIDLGPGAGTRGGRLVAQGSAAQLALLEDSITGRCLASPLKHSRSRRRPVSPSISFSFSVTSR